MWHIVGNGSGQEQSRCYWTYQKHDPKLDSSKTAGEIADKLEIQKSAVRIHLESLQLEQVVRSYFRIECLGRPKKYMR
jgi:predicted ArsR family transcriptional regulator